MAASARPRQWNSTLPQRKQGLARGSIQRRPEKPYRWPKGKKTLAWEKTRAKLKVVFEAAGITTCEVGAEQCCVDNLLGFMHRLKRRNITTQQELETVALGCWNCHSILERMPERRMFDVITQIIADRPRPVAAI
jgi:hypothetical protein